MSKQHLYSYVVLSLGGLYISQNFSWPSFVLPGDGACLLTTADCTLLQKMLRYRAEGPIIVREQQITGDNLDHIPLLFSSSLSQCPPLPLTTVVTEAMTWDQRPPVVKSILHMGASFSTQEICEESKQDLLQALFYRRITGKITFCARSERRKGREMEAPCTCKLSSVYKDIAFYKTRESCSRHAPHLGQRSEKPLPLISVPETSEVDLSSISIQKKVLALLAG